MDTNKLLKFLLYALIGGIILILVFKFYQMRQEQAALDQEQVDLQKTLRDYGYVEEDTTGTTFNADGYTDPAPAQPSVSADGIEYEAPAKPSGTKPTTTSKPAAQPQAKPPAANNPPPPQTAAPKPANPPATTTTAKSPDAGGYSDGRYRVVAGTFTVLDGARREMERLIKMGYHDAEVGKYNRGKYAVVIVKRTNSLDEAKRVAAELKRKGVDSRVIDRERD